MSPFSRSTNVIVKSILRRLVERVNKKTLDYLKMLLNQVREMEFEEWHYAIPMVEYIVNTATHSATGYAPCTLIFGTQSVEDLK